MTLRSVFVGLAMLFASFGYADERIHRFDSEITVHTDGSMTVNETIEVSAEGRGIKRGIFRDFPVRYTDDAGNRFVVDFAVLAVERDGQPEPYFIESSGAMERVYIGRKDVFLSPGRYSYRITYRTDRQLGFFAEHDELYWNVTGNEWDFPIEQASAIVTLPEDVPLASVQTAAYTGPKGARGGDYTVSRTHQGRVFFKTSKPLSLGEGLTIVVGWQPGFVQRPSATEKAQYAIRDNASWLGGLGGLIGLLGYFFTTWLRVGRDPGKGVIIPRFKPPQDMSPAAMRYIYKMGFDNTAFTAAIINIAIKGHLVIEEKKDKYILRLQDKNNFESPLSPGEKKIMAKLFTTNKTITLKKSSHRIVSRAIKALKKFFDGEYQRAYFKINKKQFKLGAILSVALIFFIALVGENGQPGSAFIAIWLAFWSVGVYGLWSERNYPMLAIFTAVEVAVLGLFFYTTVWWKSLLILTVIASAILFYHLLKAPTKLGRKMLDEIEGFKQYLEVAEEDRLNILHPPERTPQLFEKYLPYALALDVEQKWSEKFAAVLASAAVGGGEYQPGWYRGTRWHDQGINDFGRSLGSDLSSAVSSAATPAASRGSSSGFGGGGSSGGGGGGGGGGGW